MSGHKKDLEPERKALIYRAAEAVANAFRGVNKDELPLLIALRRHLG